MRHDRKRQGDFTLRFRHGGSGGGFGPGFGPGFGAGFEAGGFGPRMRGRRRRGDVRRALLMLLQLDGPRNGYQLMQALAERSEGRWQPSPGSVYPALSQLEDEGLITATQTEGESGRTFRLTDAGVEHLAQRGDTSPPWEPEGETDDTVSNMWRAFAATVRAVRQVAADGDPERINQTTQLLEETRRKLYRLLAGDE